MASIHLQGIGEVNAVPVSEVRVGSVLVFNYGYRYQVVAIEATGGAKMVTLVLENVKGDVYRQRKSLKTLVAVTK